MAFKLFKSGDDLYQEGEELIKRGEFSKARNVLQKSIDKEGGVDDVAAVKVALLDLNGNLNNVDRYQALISKLNELSASDIEFGLTKVNRDFLKMEAKLTVERLNLTDELQSGNKMKVAEKIQDLAARYQEQIGDEHLLIPEIFNNDTTTTGTVMFYDLMAMSYEGMADGTVWDDPSQAAEYQQIAMSYRQQNGRSFEENQKKIKAYSMTSKCWLCGRIATGEGILFYSAPADISPALAKDTNTVRSNSDDLHHIYICRACYSAVSYRADEISRKYYEQGMRELRTTEARLQAEIDSLRREISYLRVSN
ncbi:MAG: hypothetical protein IJ856_05760 [Candidatus Methanomethylophilaceae archaeon]|nr:hypothetical protein [Candidatus Methanomethylophilaceae archaeon]